MMFSEFLEFIQANEGAPNGKPASTTEPSEIIGTALPRVDGPLKTTGTAK